VDMTALACSTITLTTGALVTGATDLDFIGPGRDQLSIDGDMVNPVFAHVGSGELYINGFTVVNGGKYAIGGNDAPGGCIYSQGHVTLVDAGAKYCVAQASGSGSAKGGAIFAIDGVTLVGSTVSGSIA